MACTLPAAARVRSAGLWGGGGQLLLLTGDSSQPVGLRVRGGGGKAEGEGSDKRTARALSLGDKRVWRQIREALRGLFLADDIVRGVGKRRVLFCVRLRKCLNFSFRCCFLHVKEFHLRDEKLMGHLWF